MMRKRGIESSLLLTGALLLTACKPEILEPQPLALFERAQEPSR